MVPDQPASQSPFPGWCWNCVQWGCSAGCRLLVGRGVVLVDLAAVEVALAEEFQGGVRDNQAASGGESDVVLAGCTGYEQPSEFSELVQSVAVQAFVGGFSVGDLDVADLESPES